jgi:hypothetical protein
LTPLIQTLGCLTWEPLRRDEKPVEVGISKGISLGLPGAPVQLQGELQDGSQPSLFVGIEYVLVEDREAARAADRFRVSTRKYTHHLYNSLHEEVLLYHWHPDTAFEGPHLHVGRTQLGANPAVPSVAHIPTARVAVESLALFLIEELGVRPIHDTYSDIIRAHLTNFVQHRRWHA